MTTYRRLDIRALWIGVVAGVTGILCCVSPVILFLFGAASASEAISLGDHLYSDYAWYLRGAGLLVGAIATVLYLRRRRSCSLQGVRTYWRTLGGILAVAIGTYALLYEATNLLATLGGHK